MSVEPDFAVRLAFARWLWHLRHGEAPGNAEIGRAVGRTGQWVTERSRRPDAPTDYRDHAPLAGFLEVPEAWLIKGEGTPPEYALWVRWCEARGIALPALQWQELPNPANEKPASGRRKRTGNGGGADGAG